MCACERRAAPHAPSHGYLGCRAQQCLPFYYTGCKGNENNFPTRTACQRTCSVSSDRALRTGGANEPPVLGSYALRTDLLTPNADHTGPTCCGDENTHVSPFTGVQTPGSFFGAAYGPQPDKSSTAVAALTQAGVSVGPTSDLSKVLAQSPDARVGVTPVAGALQPAGAPVVGAAPAAAAPAAPVAPASATPAIGGSAVSAASASAAPAAPAVPGAAAPASPTAAASVPAAAAAPVATRLQFPNSLKALASIGRTRAGVTDVGYGVFGPMMHLAPTGDLRPGETAPAPGSQAPMRLTQVGNIPQHIVAENATRPNTTTPCTCPEPKACLSPPCAEAPCIW